MYQGIVQQEQNRKGTETAGAVNNQATKTKGLLAMLAGDKKSMKDAYK